MLYSTSLPERFELHSLLQVEQAQRERDEAQRERDAANRGGREWEAATREGEEARRSLVDTQRLVQDLQRQVLQGYRYKSDNLRAGVGPNRLRDRATPPLPPSVG